MVVILRNMLLLLSVLLLTAFRWGLMFGDMEWDEVNNAISEDFPMVSSVSMEELKVLLDSQQQLYLVDVREPAEYQVSHLPGAVLYSELQPETLEKDSMIVAYCSVGLRSAKFAQELEARGFTRVYNLRGSIFMWANSGYPLSANGHPANRVHPFNERWGKLLHSELHSSGAGAHEKKPIP